MCVYELSASGRASIVVAWTWCACDVWSWTDVSPKMTIQSLGQMNCWRRKVDLNKLIIQSRKVTLVSILDIYFYSSLAAIFIPCHSMSQFIQKTSYWVQGYDCVGSIEKMWDTYCVYINIIYYLPEVQGKINHYSSTSKRNETVTIFKNGINLNLYYYYRYVTTVKSDWNTRKKLDRF